MADLVMGNLYLLVLFSCCAAPAAATYGYEVPSPCGLNQELRCVHSCPPEQSCRNKDIRVSCLTADEPCSNKCVCKEGYYRNYLGDCISEEQCDQCPGEHEFFSCGSACDNECGTLGQQNRTSCPIVNIMCNRRCYCEDGFARDHKGTCIPQELCSPTTTCEGPNEEYTDAKRSCPPQTCISIAAFFKCDSNQPIERGCVCKPGFLRKSLDSPCVPTCECPQMQNAPECQKGRY